jgi:chromosome segregation ATPase
MATQHSSLPVPRTKSLAIEQWDNCSAAGSETFSVDANDEFDYLNKEISSEWATTVSIGNKQIPRAAVLSEEHHVFVREMIGEKSLNNLDSVDSISIACTQKVHEAVKDTQKLMWQEIHRLQDSLSGEKDVKERLSRDVEAAKKELGLRSEQIIVLQNRINVLHDAQSKQGALVNHISAFVREVIVAGTKQGDEIKGLQNEIDNLESARRTQEKHTDTGFRNLHSRIGRVEKKQENEMRTAYLASSERERMLKDHKVWLESICSKVDQLENKLPNYATLSWTAKMLNRQETAAWKSHEMHQISQPTSQSTSQNIEKKIDDLGRKVQAWRAFALNTEKKIEKLSENFATHVNQVINDYLKPEQYPTSYPDLNARYMCLWEHIRKLETALQDQATF